jgi:hypothetical protein
MSNAGEHCTRLTERLIGRWAHQIVFTQRLNFDVFKPGMSAIWLLERDPHGGSRLASTRTADTPTRRSDSTPPGRISRRCPLRFVANLSGNSRPPMALTKNWPKDGVDYRQIISSV